MGLFFLLPSFVLAQNEESLKDTVYQAKVIAILSEGEKTVAGYTNPYQEVKISVTSGDMKGSVLTIDHGQLFSVDKSQLVSVGENVVLLKSFGLDSQPFYQIIDKYRLNWVIYFFIAFFLIIMALSRWQGLGSVVGMFISLGVIIKYIVPAILAGKDPLIVSIIGCLVIMFVTIYLAHGFSRKTTVALVATFLTLVITGLIAAAFSYLSHLTGLGSEDAASLRLGPTADINFKGLLLGGMLIGALGVLDDVTTGLSASIFELAKANPKQKFKELFTAGLAIGKEHIASLVNTLVLAYAGASLPIFLILILNPSGFPLWAVLNDSLIVEEVVRTLSGSFGLVLAVPLTTFLAAFYVTRTKNGG